VETWKKAHKKGEILANFWTFLGNFGQNSDKILEILENFGQNAPKKCLILSVK